MTPIEIALLEKHLDRVAESSGNYMEFGSGNSTCMAASRTGIARIHVIESDADFFDTHVRKDAGVDDSCRSKRLTVSFAKLGEISEWGHPKDASQQHLWPLYPLEAFSMDDKWNLILVDGRFRVACCLAAVLSGFADGKCPLLIHDFHHRPHYRVLLRWFRIAEGADTLVCLERRPDFDADSARDALHRYVWLQDDHTATSRRRNHLRKYIRGILSKKK